MFNNQRYVTKGVQSDVPQYLQTMMWYYIDNMEVEQKDYLQVFEFKATVINGQTMQEMIHHQEQPEYVKELTFVAENPVTVKVFIIDDKTHSTMLLASEY